MNDKLPEWVNALLTDVAMFLDMNGYETKSDEIMAVLGQQSVRHEFKDWDAFLEAEIAAANAETSNVIEAADRFRISVA